MIRILAKVGTDEKALLFVAPNEAHKVQQQMANRFGGEWCYVDQLHLNNDVLKFNDGVVYKGFDPKQERYTTMIKRSEL